MLYLCIACVFAFCIYVYATILLLSFLFLLCINTLAANLVLEFTVERIFVGDAYGDVPLGLYLVRGENVVLVGQIVRHMNGIMYKYT